MTEKHFCSNCKKPFNTALKYCEKCGYPENGTDSEKRNYTEYNRKIIEVYALENKATEAIGVTFLFGGIYAAIGFVRAIAGSSYSFTLILFGLFVCGAGYIIKYNRYAGLALATALNVIVSLYIFNLMDLQLGMLIGLAFQLFIIRGFINTNKYLELEKQLKADKQRYMDPAYNERVKEHAQQETWQKQEKLKAELEQVKTSNDTFNPSIFFKNKEFTLEEDTGLCACCKRSIVNDVNFCSSCGYPLKGTEAEQGYFITDRKAKFRDRDTYIKRVNSARIAIYILSGLMGLLAIVLPLSKKIQISLDIYFPSHLKLTVIILAIIAVLYLACAIWSIKKPFAAMLVAFVLYITLQVAQLILDPISIFEGILWKAIILVFLVNGFVSAHKLKKINKELEA